MCGSTGKRVCIWNALMGKFSLSSGTIVTSSVFVSHSEKSSLIDNLHFSSWFSEVIWIKIITFQKHPVLPQNNHVLLFLLAVFSEAKARVAFIGEGVKCVRAQSESVTVMIKLALSGTWSFSFFRLNTNMIFLSNWYCFSRNRPKTIPKSVLLLRSSTVCYNEYNTGERKKME